MELVRGIPITDYCDQNQLTPRERLELFVLVCQAVQHAHQKGIIHRDLKPANVLVTLHDATPVPKVIDFGIAKATGQRLTDKTLFTNFAHMVGTPLYMSPEQAALSGLDVDTRSDIYALGVLLYELLTGTTPFDKERLRSAAYDEIRRIIREEEPPRPSRRLRKDEGRRMKDEKNARAGSCSSFILHPSSFQELDWIVMKCLEKDRTRRYESASGLAADVVRYLHDEPVSACPPSVAYLFRKFARRNKVVLLTAGLVALALVAGAVTSTWQAVRARRAEAGALEDRDRARDAEEQAKQDAAIAEAVNEFLNEDLLAQADPRQSPDRNLKLRLVLDRASKRIEGRFADQPLVEARLRRTLATTYESLGEYRVAQRHAERAQELYQRALGAEHPDTLAAMNSLAQILWWQWRYEEARRLHEETLSLRRRVLGAEHPETLKSMYSLATVLWRQERLEEAYRLHKETLEVRRRVLGPEHPDTLLSMHQLATVLYDQERYDDARKLHEETLSLQRRVLGVEHPDTLRSMFALANDLDCQGHSEEACKLHQETLDMRRRVLTAEHPDTLLSMNNLAWLLANAPDKKVRNPARAVELAREVAQKAPEKRFAWNTLGVAYYRAGDWNQAISTLQRSVDLARDGGVAQDWFFLAMAHWQLGKTVGGGPGAGGNAENATAQEQARRRREARMWYDRGVAWMEANQPRNGELLRFRAEAAELLGIKEPPPNAPMK
jgi:tetratricopeptide (TPR) repeat protein